MIDILKIAKYFETEMNAELHKSFPLIDFFVWASAGEVIKPVRTMNQMHENLPVVLTSVSSANEGDLLPMGVNSLSLEFLVPLKQMKTDAKQTPQELSTIQDSQYTFPNAVIEIVNNLFKVSKVSETEGTDGERYTFSINAGRAITGAVRDFEVYGRCLPFSVSVLLSYLQGGVNGRNIELLVDGVQIPTLTMTISRSGKTSSDVFSNAENTVKNIDTASALSIDFTVPYTQTEPTKNMMDYLLNNKLNTAHFVNLKAKTATGDIISENNYLMKFENVSETAQDVQFVGLTASLVEINPNPLLMDLPLSYEIGKFIFIGKLRTATVPILAETSAYCGGRFFYSEIQITPEMCKGNLIYNPTTQNYEMYVFTQNGGNYQKVIVANQIEYEVIRGAK